MPVKLKNGRILNDTEIQQLNDANNKIINKSNTAKDLSNVNYAKSLGWTPTVKSPKVDETKTTIEKTPEEIAGDASLNKGALETNNNLNNSGISDTTMNQGVKEDNNIGQNMVTMKSPSGTYATVDKNSSEYQNYLNQGYKMSTETMNSADVIAQAGQQKQSENTAKEIAKQGTSTNENGADNGSGTSKTTEDTTTTDTTTKDTTTETNPILKAIEEVKKSLGASSTGVTTNMQGLNGTETERKYKDENTYSTDYLSKYGTNPTKEQINKAVYGTSTPNFKTYSASKDVMDKIDSNGFQDLNGEDIESLAKSLATSGLSLADSLTLFKSQNTIPETVRQKFFDSLGISKLEQQAFFAPDQDTQTLYDTKYKELNLKSKLDEINKAKEDMNNELSIAGEDPFMDETQRQGRSKMISDRYTNKITKLTDEYNQGIDQVNTYISNNLATMTNAQAKLTYMQQKAESMLSGIQEEQDNSLLNRFLPSYLKEQQTASSTQAEKDLISKLTVDKGYSEVTGWTQDDINNAINSGYKVQKVGNKVYALQPEGSYQLQTGYNPVTGEEYTRIFNTKTGTFMNGGAGTGTGNGTGGAGGSSAGVSGNTITLKDGSTYSDKGYAKDSTHTTQVANLYNDLNTTYKKSNDIATIDNYLKSKGIVTPFESEQYGAGETIVSIADEYGVDPLLLTSLISQESIMGTSGVAKKNNNYGGITYNPNSSTNNYGGVKGSARPAKEGGNYVKFATVENGLRAQAQLLSNRIKPGTTQNAPETIKTTTETEKTPARQIAEQIDAGTRDIKDITDKNLKTAVTGELAKLREEKYNAESDPVIKSALKSEGGNAMTDTAITKIDNILSTKDQLDSLKSSIMNIKTGPITGLINNKNLWSKDTTVIKQKIQGLIPILARGVFGEVGVLTDQDIENYRKTIPNLKTPESAKAYLINNLLDTLQNKFKNVLTSQAGGGRDVSAYIKNNTYQDFADSIKSLKIDTNALEEQKKEDSNPGKWWSTIFGENKTTKVDDPLGVLK